MATVPATPAATPAPAATTAQPAAQTQPAQAKNNDLLDELSDLSDFGS